MKLYVNDKGEIKDVNSTTDLTLKEIEISDKQNPFLNWSVAKICCHKVKVTDETEISFTPYIDSKLIEHIDQLGKGNEKNSNNLTDTQIGLAQTYEKTIETDTTVTDMQIAMVELYEMIMGGM